jgi:Cof subfamily protein (haloacid dehalogenase superfamily)
MSTRSRLDGKIIKLVVSDIDGTIVHEDLEVQEHILLGLEKAISSGIRITLASGRNRREMHWYLSKLRLMEPYIAMGGAFAEDPRNDHVIFYKTLDIDFLDFILSLGRKLELGIMVEYPDEVFYEGGKQNTGLTNRLTSPIQHLSCRELQSGLAPGKVILIGENDQLTEAENRLAGFSSLVDFARSRPSILDITAQNSNKGEALRVISEYMDIPTNQIAVIGDGLNDVSLFEYAGLSIAMGNGNELLKSRADWIAPHFQEDGFLWALNNIQSINLEER